MKIHKLGKNGGKGMYYKYIVVLEILIKTILHRCLLYRMHDNVGVGEVKKLETETLPGHFAVIAVKCKKPERFMVALGCLTNPGFLRLLNKAGEEYGFKHEGAITIPCGPRELQLVLQEMHEK
ncbi:hypothetical protein Ccrd_022379 [Cynara cardunculus var. scolymus]|uniref:Auxin responsive SAUR protein n=1 Tax=Cynara cardunculus var. scolymus TaxID=59895 RepID=A0A103XYY3_CYNCS|nr:hypothetical protein Ccrd_022379 [Cynara cardunculus var. scolymus]